MAGQGLWREGGGVLVEKRGRTAKKRRIRGENCFVSREEDFEKEQNRREKMIL